MYIIFSDKIKRMQLKKWEDIREKESRINHRLLHRNTNEDGERKAENGDEGLIKRHA